MKRCDVAYAIENHGLFDPSYAETLAFEEALRRVSDADIGLLDLTALELLADDLALN